MMDDVAAGLRGRILGVLGLSVIAVACADRSEGDSAGEGSGTEGSGPGSGPDGTPQDDGSGPGDVDGGPAGDDTTPDCGADVSMTVCVAPEGGSGGESTSDTSGGGDGTSSGGAGTAGSEGGAESTGVSEDDGTAPPAEPDCTGLSYPYPGFCVYGESAVFVQDGQCCWMLEGTQNCCDGRPFIVDDRARTAAAIPRADWIRPSSPHVDDLSLAERESLASAWEADARMEHASIASFSRFVLHLLALGAPASLVEDAQRALADEIDHARRCFGLVSAYRGVPTGPGALSIDGALSETTSLAEAAAAAVREGCIGETLAAYQAARAARRTRDPVVRDHLEAIADDEARHAALSWRFVAWAIEQGGDAVRDAVAAAFARPLPAIVRAPAPIEPHIWAAHGRFSFAELADVLTRADREIVKPCAARLLGRSPDRDVPAARVSC